MKKLIVYILLLAFAFSFTACAAANQAVTDVKALEKEVTAALWKHQYLPEGTGIGAFRYYGTDNGYHIVFFTPPAVLGEKTIVVADSSFYYHETFYLIAYKNGKVIDLATANAQGIVSKEAIAKAAELHAEQKNATE